MLVLNCDDESILKESFKGTLKARNNEFLARNNAFLARNNAFLDIININI